MDIVVPKATIELQQEVRAALEDPEVMPDSIQIKGEVYTLESHAGGGYKGVVWSAKDSMGRDRAIKFTIAEDYEDRSYLQELSLAARLEPYDEFARFFHAEIKELDLGALGLYKFVCFVEEWIKGKTLNKYLEENRSEVTSSFLIGYVRGISSALRALEVNKLKHDDMHASNVMIADPVEGGLSNVFKIKVIDTGSLKSVQKLNLKPKDDHRHVIDHLVSIWNTIYNSKILSSRDRRFLHSTKALLNSMLDDDPTTRLRSPSQIKEHFEHAYTRAAAPVKSTRGHLLAPFEFISAEHIADDRLLVDIFASSVPWFGKVAGPDPCLVTGPRGCGKSTIFRWLSLKAQLHKPERDISDLRIAGFYLSCSADLQNRVGWVDTQGLAKRFQKEIIHYFNLLASREVVQTLSSISRRKDRVSYFGFGITEETSIYKFMIEGLGLLQKPLLQGVPRLDQLGEAIEREMSAVHSQILRGSNVSFASPETFLSDLSSRMARLMEFFRQKKITFLIDDFSVHRVPEQVQKVLNLVIWERQPSHIFKLSSEKLGAINTKPSARPAATRRSGAEGSDGRFLRSQLRRISPGRCPQARPCRQRPHPITITSAELTKPEFSTLHKIGTFYFALTDSE